MASGAPAEPSNVKPSAAWRPLHLCSRFDDVDTLKDLLQHKADVDEPAFEVNMSALQVAAASNMTNSVALLIKAKANVNGKDKRGHTPLYSAAARGHYNVVLLMHELAASDLNINVRSRLGWTPLFAAVRHNHQRTVQVLLQLKADATIRNAFEMTVLHIAAHRGYHGVMELLLTAICADFDANASTEFVNREMPTSIMIKAIEVVAQMDMDDDDQKSAPTKRTLLTSGETALMVAAKKGDVEMCKLLLERRAWPLHPNSLKASAVDFAKVSASVETRALLDKWSVLQSCPASPKCATLCQAARARVPAPKSTKFGHLECVCFLLSAKACPNHYDRKLRPDILPYTTPLTIAAGSGNPAIVRKLLEAKAFADGLFDMPHSEVMMFRDSTEDQNVVPVPERMSTPLAVAACKGQYTAVMLLCEAKACVNAQVAVSQFPDDVASSYCATAIFAAARGWSVASVAALIQAKADLNLKDSNKDTVLEAVAKVNRAMRNKINPGRVTMSSEAAGAYAAALHQLERVAELLSKNIKSPSSSSSSSSASADHHQSATRVNNAQHAQNGRQKERRSGRAEKLRAIRAQQARRTT
jgi:ankyrin repeat protein